MKVISFLGTANYSETTFAWQEKQHTTRFFPVAVAHFIQPQTLLVCATPTVQAHPNLVELGHHLDQMGIAWQVVPIPEGHSETDLWQIFDRLTEAVENDETVIFDVTHSFRSLPMLAFLAVAYLQAAKRVHVQRVLYGAWEARDKASDISPVFDLTPFVRLLDWLTATSRFVETGDGYALAQLLKGGMPSGPQMGSDMKARALGNNLKLGAKSIEDISLALRLSRPIEAMQAAAQLGTSLNQALPDIVQTARPFAVLAEQVTKEYGQFALALPKDTAQQENSLRLQLKMIKWYVERRQVVQAATLAREWVVSILAVHFGAPMIDEKGRKPVEEALNNALEKRKTKPRHIKSGIYDAEIEKISFVGDLCSLWSEMTALRNDIAHVGMRVKPQSAADLQRKVTALYPRLESLAEKMLPSPSINAS